MCTVSSSSLCLAIPSRLPCMQELAGVHGSLTSPRVCVCGRDRQRLARRVGGSQARAARHQRLKTLQPSRMRLARRVAGAPRQGVLMTSRPERMPGGCQPRVPCLAERRMPLGLLGTQRRGVMVRRRSGEGQMRKPPRSPPRFLPGIDPLSGPLNPPAPAAPLW